MQEKEEKAIILDYLPHGYFGQERRTPVAQAIGIQNLTLLQLVPRKGISLSLKEEVYIGSGKRDKISYILGRLYEDKLTQTARSELEDFLKDFIEKKEKRFLEFFNNSEAVNTRLHQLELLPGFGKKHTEMILKAREDKPFESFEDIKKRIKNIPDPKKAIEKRIYEELEAKPKYRLFTK